MSGMGTWLALLVSLGLLMLSAFFVAVEFALVGARRYRLEDAADRSLGARAALRSARELPLLLAGSQLGITLCTLALGAIAEPAVHHLLAPLVEAIGIPDGAADVAAFVLALMAITFVHLVVGEMAPKSWAISHPERSATLLAVPMRLFMWFTRPALIVLNAIANWCLRRVGIQPVDEVSVGRTPADLLQLVDHSAKAGALDRERRNQLAVALDMHRRPLKDFVQPDRRLAVVTPDATIEQITAVVRETGHLRLLVRAPTGALGVVHVRDTLTKPAETTAAELMRPVLTLAATTPAYTALSTMRARGSHLAVVATDGRPLSVLTMHDLLELLMPSEPGRPPTASSVR